MSRTRLLAVVVALLLPAVTLAGGVSKLVVLARLQKLTSDEDLLRKVITKVESQRGKYIRVLEKLSSAERSDWQQYLEMAKGCRDCAAVTHADALGEYYTDHLQLAYDQAGAGIEIVGWGLEYCQRCLDILSRY